MSEPLRIIRKAVFLLKNGQRAAAIADECHRLFALAHKETNHEQFEALHAAHSAKAAEYDLLMEEFRKL